MTKLTFTTFISPTVLFESRTKKLKNTDTQKSICVFGDPYEIRTRVTAVKGRCLRPLDQRAVGGCNWIRTNDTAGMNRML